MPKDNEKSSPPAVTATPVAATPVAPVEDPAVTIAKLRTENAAANELLDLQQTELNRRREARKGGPEAMLEALVAGQAQLNAVVTRLLEAQEPPRPAEKRPLDPRHKGTKTYRLGGPHYRLGEYYETGRLITVVDEEPAPNWELVTAESLAQEAAPLTTVLPPVRPSDAEV